MLVISVAVVTVVAAGGGLVEVVEVVQHQQLGGSGDLVSRLIMGIFKVTIWVIGVINLLTKSP